MKRFLGLLIFSMLLTVIAATLLLSFNASATTAEMVENVIYISDSAVEGGDGSSANKPLYPVVYPDSQLNPVALEQTQSGGGKTTVTVKDNYKNTALYQAVEKLSETGGTVVICGNVEISDEECRGSSYSSVLEYHLPETKKPVRITSVYDGKDYRSNAKLTLSGHFYLILNTETLWEKLNIHSNLVPDRAICCNGNKTVFGDGINVTANNTSSSAYYPSIAGGHRYNSFTSDVDITIKSGRFYKLVGTTWTNPSPNIVNCKGNVNMVIDGGRISYVYGNSHNTVPNSLHHGNVNITVNGGQIDGSIACTGNGGFYSENYEANIKINGGTFGSSFKVLSRMTYHQTVLGCESKNITIDLSDTLNVKNSVLNNIVTNCPTGASLVYPAHWITDSHEVKSFPEESFVFCGDVPSSKGASLRVEYKNPVNGEEYSNQIIEYTKENTAFKVDCDTTKAGKATADYYYGGWKYHTATVDVVAAPEVEILGVKIRTDSREQQMLGCAKYTFDKTSPVTVESCGIIAVPSDMLLTDAPFEHSNTVGMYDTVAEYELDYGTTVEFRAMVLGDDVIRENNYNRDYSMRAYVKISYNGNEYYRYSDIIERCLYDVAKSAIAGDVEENDVKNYLDRELVEVHDNYDESYLYNPERAAEARKKVVDYMTSMQTIEWTPKETFIIYNEGIKNTYSAGEGTTRMYGVFYKGQKYHGIPYINIKMTTKETFLDMAENAEIIPLDDVSLKFSSMSDFNALTPAQKEAGLQNAKLFPGNDCLTSVLYAWNTVLNNREEISLMNSCVNILGGKYGVIAVGEYDNSDFCNNNTKVMIQERVGEQVIARAYAQLKPGDVTIYVRKTETENARHARLIVGAQAHVEYQKDYLGQIKTDSEGNKLIDLENSYVTFMDQGGGSSTRYIYNNTISSIQVKNRTFRQMIDEGSLPVTIPELATGNYDDEFTYISGTDFESELPKGEIKGTVKSNRQIISVRAVIKNNGNTVGEIDHNVAPTGGMHHIGEFDLNEIDLSGIEMTSGTNYEFDLFVCVSGLGGNELKLVSDYEFIAK